MSKISIVKAFTEKYYHVLPTRLETITTSPEREAIFKHLSQIGSDRFVEFVTDILLTVERHRLGDITDGPGDEKQDILTMTPLDERQLTQCKHTQKYDEHYSGDELDLLFAAAFRKGCKRALFVTNSDLTTQGKRYVNDKEYARGPQTEATVPVVDYWNGERIWQRVVNSPGILNKWFSGMAQTHGLRSFSFDVAIMKLPDSSFNDTEYESLFMALDGKDGVQKIDEDMYQIYMDDDVSFTITKWFRSDLDLDARYVPQEEHWIVNSPVRVLRIQVTVKANIVYRPDAIQEKITSYLSGTTRAAADPDEWWYMIATSPQAFVFLHDVATPTTISIGPSQSFVKVGDSLSEKEKKWILPSATEFQRIVGDDGDELHWQHLPSGFHVRLMLSQRPHPIASYENHLRQLNLIKDLRDYKFFVVPSASRNTVDLIRNMSGTRAIVMVSGGSTCFFALPEQDDEKLILKPLQARGISPHRINEKRKNEIIEDIDRLPILEWMITSSENDLVTPVMLNRRIFWMTTTTEVYPPAKKNDWLELLKFKREYEKDYGAKYSSRGMDRLNIDEIQACLFDMITIRGRRMLDISATNGRLHVTFRVYEPSIASSDAILPGYIAEMEELIARMNKIL